MMGWGGVGWGGGWGGVAAHTGGTGLLDAICCRFLDAYRRPRPIVEARPQRVSCAALCCRLEEIILSAMHISGGRALIAGIRWHHQANVVPFCSSYLPLQA